MFSICLPKADRFLFMPVALRSFFFLQLIYNVFSSLLPLLNHRKSPVVSQLSCSFGPRVFVYATVFLSPFPSGNSYVFCGVQIGYHLHQETFSHLTRQGYLLQCVMTKLFSQLLALCLTKSSQAPSQQEAGQGPTVKLHNKQKWIMGKIGSSASKNIYS